MNSRYSLWLICICCVGLAGCATWQNRAGHNSAPGSAATFNAAPAPAGPLLSAPGTSMGQPPPPVAPAPSGPGMTLPPMGSAPTGERLDLGSVAPPASAPVRETSHAAVPDRMYNLEKSSGSSQRIASADSGSSRKSSTISRLAKKADSSDESSDAKPSRSDAKPSRNENADADQPSALERLAREAGTSSRKVVAEQLPAPNSSSSSLPRPSNAPEQVRNTSAGSGASASPAVAEPAAIDTTLLAQPVRKGAGDDEIVEPKKESQGPQSRVLPNSKLFNGVDKPAIYPVSNPVVEEQVDITQFS